MRRAAYFSLAIVGLLAFASLAVAATIGVVVTGTVTAQCTGTATLPDGSPSGLTTTFVAPCTGTLTYTSTSTLPTSTTGSSTSVQQAEMVDHAFVLGCPAPLHVPGESFEVGPQFVAATDNLGRDAWNLMFIVSDSTHNQTLVLSMTTLNKLHNLSATMYQGSTVTFSKTVVDFGLAAFGFPRDILPHDAFNFYFDGDSMNAEWYEQGVAGNVLITTGSFGIATLTPTGFSTVFAPLAPATGVTFSKGALGLLVSGEENTGPAILPIAFVVTPGATPPCETPLAVGLSNVIGTNMCEENAYLSNPAAFTASLVGD